MRLAIGKSRSFWRWLAPCAVIVLAILGLLSPRTTSAHVTLDRSNPTPNSVLAQSPGEIRLWFSEPIEQRESTIRLFDRTGAELPEIQTRAGDTPESLVAPLPKPLATGTYSIVWNALSAADGHPLQGYFTFTVGAGADVAPVTVPLDLDTGGAPLWLQSVARWLVLLTLAVAVAVWPVWLLVLWPALRNEPALARAASMHAGMIGFGAVVAGVLANLLMLGVQASFLQRGSLVSRMSETLTETRFGRLWVARVGLLLLLAMALRMVPWLEPLRKRALTAVGLIVAALAPVPLSLNAHAAGVNPGRTPAIVFDLAHLLAASLWFGGLVLLIGLLSRSAPVGVDRRAVFGRAIPRFSAMALVCWGVLVVTGLYATWLHIGSRDALLQTGYGQSLLFKLIVVGIVLLIATANLLLITRKLAETDTDTNSRWVGWLGYAVVAEVVLAALILLAVGRMTSQQPGREVIAAERTGRTTHFVLDGRDATVRLFPGAAGPNHILVTIPGDPLLPMGTETLLRVTYQDAPIGEREVLLGRTTQSTFETHGSEIGMIGNWTVELVVRKTGEFEWTDTQTIAVDLVGSSAPREPWRFDTGGVIGLVLIGIALIGFATAWRAGKGRLRMETGGLGAAAALLGLMLMAQGRIQPTAGYDPGLLNPVPATADVVARGGVLYQEHCLSCHGAGGFGDGPLSAGMFPKPADFSAPHTRAHPDGQLFTWIQNGKPGTDMPAFGSTFTDEQIWEVIDYIQVAFQDEPLVEASPATGS